MRWILPFVLCLLPVCVGCSKEKTGEEKRKERDEAPRVGFAEGKNKAEMEAAFKAAAQDAAPPAPGQPPKAAKEPEKKDKPRKIRYTGDMKLIVEKIGDAEEALDAARKEAKGEYEKAEVNKSANIARNGLWRIRVPVENLQSFRKAVAKIGEVEKDIIESEDMTAKYYDLDAHITNRKIDRDGIREFVKEIGKKDQRYREVMRELEAITDEIDRKEGQLRLWKDQTDLTTFTVHMRERQPYVAPAKVEDKEVVTFGMRANHTWNSSWDYFLGFCQGLLIATIAVAPWLPLALVFCTGLWLVLRRLGRSEETPVAVKVGKEPPATT